MKISSRKKVNFMVEKTVLKQLMLWIPAGDRSDFVNNVLGEALRAAARRKALEGIDALRDKYKIKMTTAEMIRLKNYGRE